MTLFEACSILNVSSWATQVEIRDAYRKLALQSHPDLNPNNEGSEAQLKRINAAYETLCKHVSRRARLMQPVDCEAKPKAMAGDRECLHF